MRARQGEGIVDEISTGEQGAFACMLGGDDGRTLFICAAPGFAEHERIGATDAQLLAVQVDVPHGGMPVIHARRLPRRRLAPLGQSVLARHGAAVRRRFTREHARRGSSPVQAPAGRRRQ